MKPPKCRICGAREFDHKCDLGEAVRPSPEASGSQAGGETMSRAPRRWHEESGADGEPQEVSDKRSRPAKFYAPAGQCSYCDARRAAARRSMASIRERGEDL